MRYKTFMTLFVQTLSRNMKRNCGLIPAGPLPLVGICYPEIAPQVVTAGSIRGLKRSPRRHDVGRMKKSENKAFKGREKKNDAEEGGNDKVKGNAEEEKRVCSRFPAT
jgi:hypothetical protein